MRCRNKVLLEMMETIMKRKQQKASKEEIKASWEDLTNYYIKTDSIYGS